MHFHSYSALCGLFVTLDESPVKGQRGLPHNAALHVLGLRLPFTRDVTEGAKDIDGLVDWQSSCREWVRPGSIGSWLNNLVDVNAISQYDCCKLKFTRRKFLLLSPSKFALNSPSLRREMTNITQLY
ncbi:hypothetical protein OPQ81_002688 [Rhizoctonia solani]|nr:hypothetical protein OPQ81_002688 [Rhizoctonia solani]